MCVQRIKTNRPTAQPSPTSQPVTLYSPVELAPPSLSHQPPPTSPASTKGKKDLEENRVHHPQKRPPSWSPFLYYAIQGEGDERDECNLVKLLSLSLTICFFRSLNEIFVWFFVNSGRGRIFSRGIFHWERVQSVPLPGLSPGGLDITGIAANQLSMNMNEDVRRKNRTFKKNTK
jgi:hypothetical protein